MIERFFRKSHVRRRLEEGPLAGVVRDYLGRLEQRGYSPFTIHQYVQAAEHFGRWLTRSGRAVADADIASVEDFLARHLPRCRCRTPRSRTTYSVRAALHQLLAGVGVDRRRVDGDSSRGLIGTVVEDFDRHLTDTCGAAAATRRYYLREARAFLVMQFGEGPVDLTSVTAAAARAFVTMRAKALTPASTNVVVTAVRSFGRYLQLRGVRASAWTAAVPRAADWRLARVPRVLTDEEVDALLAAVDRTRAHGRRDYAIALCLLDLGLRASEVADLTLADVDWRAGILTLPAGKIRRGSSLPLPVRVARALADYLRNGRPETSDRALFVHHRPPRGRRIGPGVVRSAMRLAYARADLDSRLTGTHVLRHTAATRLLRAGVSIKEIADLLRHRSLDTSAIYAKVDLPALAAVALPWPEVRS
jgi:site-specific recombinase XerD